MKSRKLVIILSWLCVLATMTMIFLFSSQNAEKSTETSTGFVEDVLQTVLPKDEVTPELVQRTQMVIPFRKIAHFGIFMLLGFSLINAFRLTVNSKWYISYICSFLSGVIYAITDEWHQNFIDGRGATYKDVLIDSAGVIVGIAVFAGFYYLDKYIKQKSKKPIK